MKQHFLLVGIALALLVTSMGHSAETKIVSEKALGWPSWRGDGSGATRSGATMVGSLDEAKLAWQSDEIGLSGCMYPGGSPGTGWCDPIIADGRVFVYWFRRAGTDLVDMHCLPASRGWASLIDPPDEPEAFGKKGGHRSALPSKEMSALQRHIRADDIIDCFDDRTGKRLWRRVFPLRGINHVRVYSPLCVPCVRDGVLYALGSAGNVYALDVATGKTIWESDIGRRRAEFDQVIEVFAASRVRAWSVQGRLNTSVVCADSVVAISEGWDVSTMRGTGGLVGLDAATGRRLWVVPDCVDHYSSPMTWRNKGKEYFLLIGKRMLLIEPKTGKVLWSKGSNKEPISDGVIGAAKGDLLVVNKNAAKVVGKDYKPWMRGPSCWRISPTDAELVWSLPIDICGGISMIAPVIDGDHAYVPIKKGVACVELATGKIVGEAIPGASGAYKGYAMGDGLLFALGNGKHEVLVAAKAFPEMKRFEGVLPGTPDRGEIHTPATANGRVYWRGRSSLWCYDFRKDPPVSSTNALPSARNLSAIAEDPAKLGEIVANEGWPTRAAACEYLRLLGNKAGPAVKALQAALLDGVAAGDWGDVQLLVDTLRAIDPAATVPAAPGLAKLLADEDERTVLLGCHGLARMGPSAAKATDALVRLLDPATPQIAAMAARALGRIGPGAHAAAPALLKVLDAEDPALGFEASRALCRVAPTDAETRMRAIDAVIAHPWYVRIAVNAGSAAPARGRCGRSVTLSYLGEQALPELLKRAQAISEQKRKDGEALNDYSPLAELAGAAQMLRPESAKDFLPLFAKIPPGNIYQVLYDRLLIYLTRSDLAGEFDQRNPRKIFGVEQEREVERWRKWREAEK